MAIPISSYGQFKDKFNMLKDATDLFAFFLFDDRPSHQAIERFADEEFQWLDGLASYAKIFFFIFLRRDPSRDGEVINPSLHIAHDFGISPNKLPGVVLFTLSEDKNDVSEGVYLPLESKLFVQDISRVEEVFSDLFTLIGDCRKEATTTSELLKVVRKKVETLRQRERFRPVTSYLKLNLQAIATLPRDFIHELEKAFANAIATKTTGG